tara:strand:+ start:1065 stop:1688 length:624 start_codon:yes stop_codon:yes gene_type:complete
MKLLLENWREYLNEEELLTEAAFGPKDLPENTSVVLSTDETGASIYLAERAPDGWVGISHGDNWGEIDINPATETRGFDCGGAWIVSTSMAGSGWGPMLYDIAIEHATIVAEGLTPDRFDVSYDAKRIWRYYLESRPDVQAHQLEDKKYIKTGETEYSVAAHPDGCPQDAAGPDWEKSPLSKRYTKAPTMINRLQKMGKLIENGDLA